MARLIINADDCGCFPWVTAGILAAADTGGITATGIMANAGDFAAAAAALRRRTELDLGVHLNVTLGQPLTAGWPTTLRGPGNALPTPGRLACALLRTPGAARAVQAEWRAQIERCIAAGLPIRFLNSHEHVHMLPRLSSIAHRLAGEFGIAHVRQSPFLPELRGGWRDLVRGTALGALRLLTPGRGRMHEPQLVGIAHSGQLDVAELLALASRLRGNGTYELMCHPGHDAPAGIEMPAHVRRYHRWQQELDALCDGRVRAALRDNGVTLVRYRDLPAPAATA